MNPKIRKIETELEKARKKISELQDHVRELEQQKTELENTDIVGLVRDAGMQPQELAALIQAYYEKAGSSVQEDTKNED
jgi:septal ring factor EnvC (AmiA/AmiB activator)